jgi:hypothetical protein
MPAVKVPADVELEDRLAFGLTAKQLALLAGAAVAAYGSFLLLAPLLPTPLAAAAPLLVAAGGGVLALLRRDGLSGDQLALALARFALTPKRQLLAPEGLPARMPGAPRGPRRAALDIPIRRVLASGLVELADGSHCRLLAAQGTSFELRSPDEQLAFVTAFARFLNALADAVQVVVRSEPASLNAHADRLARTEEVQSAGLRAAALDHGRFLRSLSDKRPLRRRRILLVLRARERRREPAQAALARLAADAGELLLGAGVVLHPLDGDEVAQQLAATLDPPGPLEDSQLQGEIHARPTPHHQDDAPTGSPLVPG